MRQAIDANSRDRYVRLVGGLIKWLIGLGAPVSALQYRVTQSASGDRVESLLILAEASNKPPKPAIPIGMGTL